MKSLFILFVFVLGSLASAQSAWNQEKGHGYAELSLSQIGSYDSLFFDGSDEVSLSSEVEEQLIQLYGEYGVSDNVTLIMSVPFFNATVSGGGVDESYSALGNIRFGSRVHIYSGELEVSAQIDVDANTGDFDASSGISTGYDAWTVSPYINIGKGFDRFYAQGFIGANFRTDNFSHSFRLGAEVGFKVLESFSVAGVLNVQKSLKNGDVSLNSNNLSTGLFVNDQEFVSTGIKIIWSIKDNLGVTASILGATSGNLVPKAPSTNLGFFAKF